MSIYQHYRKHEHPFVDQVLSWMEQVENTFVPYVTDFLDPREQQIVTTVIGANHDVIKFTFFGGSEEAERKRAVIAPFYEAVQESDAKVILLNATFPAKFVSLSHSDVLGAFLSLGIERKKIGDINVLQDELQLFIAEELEDYVRLNLTQIKKASIELKKQSAEKSVSANEEWAHRSHTVSSLRLDVLVKEIYKMSRKDAHTLIQANKVKINHTYVDNPATQLLEGDLISVRKYGRSKLVEESGKTRKDKHKITVAILKT
ncbi:MAG TPA: YlmH/Sll1252 family protein [Pseudogracilibacillus sp.]|nr:YlmH/Sll1252 family protein [Pseudogracilibacillus sp.]